MLVFMLGLIFLRDAKPPLWMEFERVQRPWLAASVKFSSVLRKLKFKLKDLLILLSSAVLLKLCFDPLEFEFESMILGKVVLK